MTEDTAIGGPSHKFPATRWSAIVAARSGDAAERARALETIVAGYWKPVYKYIRFRWNKSNEDAKDLTQEFFVRVIEKDFLKNYDPAKARLRTFLRTCVDGLVANEDRAARRLKRGGDALHVPLDFDSVESELTRIEPSVAADLDGFFEKEWVRSFFGLVVESLRAECEARGKSVHFRLFQAYDLEADNDRDCTYDELAPRFGLGVTDVTNYLAWARRAFRRLALDKLREMAATEEEFQREARVLFGAGPK